MSKRPVPEWATKIAEQVYDANEDWTSIAELEDIIEERVMEDIEGILSTLAAQRFHFEWQAHQLGNWVNLQSDVPEQVKKVMAAKAE